MSGPAALVWLMLLRSLAIPSNPNDILGISGCTEWRFGKSFCYLFSEDWCKLIDKCVSFTDVCCCWDARGSLQCGDALVLFTE